MKKNLVLSVIATVACSVVLLSGSTASADIVWGSSSQMWDGSGSEAFVSTNGVFAAGINGNTGATTATVNGVVFTGAGTDTAIGAVETITIDAGTDNLSSFGAGEFGAGNVGDLIQGSVWAADSITLNNLIIGETYEIQVFANDARGNRSTNFIMGLGDGSGTGPVGTLLLNNSPSDGSAPVAPQTNAGDYITGTFVADMATEVILAYGTNSGVIANLTNGDSRGQVAGVQLRNITAVPEPGCLAFLGLGVLGLVSRRRK